MRIRIGNYQNQYWIEGFTFFKWRRLPSIARYIDTDANFAYWDIGSVKYYESYEKAREVASEYIAKTSKKYAVYNEVK